MLWSQNDNEYFAQFYYGALRKLEEYLPRREIDTDRLLELIADAKKQISEIEEIVEEMKIWLT
jgi:hypothetical protein